MILKETRLWIFGSSRELSNRLLHEQVLPRFIVKGAFNRKIDSEVEAKLQHRAMALRDHAARRCKLLLAFPCLPDDARTNIDAG